MVGEVRWERPGLEKRRRCRCFLKGVVANELGYML